MEHIKWIFSGVGVAILTVVLSWLVSKRRRHTRHAPSGTGRGPVEAESAGSTEARVEESSFPAKRVQISRRVAVGDYCEFPIRPDYTLRITVEDVRPVPAELSVLKEHTLGAELSVSSRWTYPGRSASETGRNRFLVPVIAGIEEAECVYGFSSDDNSPYFYRICVRHINPHARTADLEFVVVRSGLR